MLLPGGVVRDGDRRREFSFKPLNGELELAIVESRRAFDSWPARVTAVLSAALAEVGGSEATPEVVASMCVADRQFLVRQLAAWLGRDDVWLSARCASCGEPFDFQLRQTELPIKPAGESYPFASVEAGGERRRLRVPNGADQEAVASIAGQAEAIAELVRRCLIDGDPEAAASWSAEEIDRVERALEAVSPEVGVAAAVECPECGHGDRIAIDPYLALQREREDLFAEVHALASAYHWSEAEILAMPSHRRRTYVDLLDQARGMVH